jgi:ADP-ribose pyrophosphatase YjhB (NUDIX family)
MRVLTGDSVATGGVISVGCSAAVVDDAGSVLLGLRDDSDYWSLPGGGLDPGEDVNACCVRETKEETGLEISVVGLIGVYSSPDMAVVYRDGVKRQIVGLSFLARIVGGQIEKSAEFRDIGFFTFDDAQRLALNPFHIQRLRDAELAVQEPGRRPFIR